MVSHRAQHGITFWLQKKIKKNSRSDMNCYMNTSGTPGQWFDSAHARSDSCCALPVSRCALRSSAPSSDDPRSCLRSFCRYSVQEAEMSHRATPKELSEPEKKSWETESYYWLRGLPAEHFKHKYGPECKQRYSFSRGFTECIMEQIKSVYYLLCTARMCAFGISCSGVKLQVKYFYFSKVLSGIM